ncbi:MAG: glycosyltransferase [Clostridia bacterium]|nr:glycosyltransferase [Clostridia bacterium]
MKIAIDLTSFGAKFKGGKEQVVCNLIEGMLEAEPTTELTLFCYSDFYQKALKLAPNAEIIILKGWKHKRLVKDIFNRTFLLKKHIKKADLLFFPMYYTGFSKFKIPTIVLPHDIQFKSKPENFDVLTRIKETILYWIDFRLRDHIIAISEFDSREIRKHYPGFADKVMHIPNPIKVIKPETKNAGKHLIAVNIGFAHKNVDVILKAYAMVRSKLGMPLVLVGDLYEKIQVSGLIEQLGLVDFVELPGYVSNEELADLMNDSYAYLTASDYEGFGMPSVEAMMYGVPVVSSRQEALEEVTFSKSFYYSPVHDHNAMANCILRLAENYPDEKNLNELMDLAYKNFDFINVAKRYLDFFRKITCRVIYCDPMSYNNLAAYDKNLLERMKEVELFYAANTKLATKTSTRIGRIYRYSDKKFVSFKAFSYFLSQLRLVMISHRFKADAVHVQWSRMPRLDAIIFKMMKKLQNVRLIYTSHDTFTHNKEETSKKQFIDFMKIADEIIVHTEKAKAELHKYGLSDISVINHGLLRLDEIYPESKIPFEKKNRIVFSMLGYMEAYKGTDILLKAWLTSQKLLGDEGIHLLLAGVNRMGSVPCIQDGANITFEDKKFEDSEFTALMKVSDVVIMPYQRISQSGLLLSALAMGRNVIVNDVGEMAKPVLKYGVGWVINAGDHEELREQLENIVDEIHMNGLKNFGQSIIDAIDEDYSWDEAAAKTQELYRKRVSL